jgi:hypothetical protein
MTWSASENSIGQYAALRLAFHQPPLRGTMLEASVPKMKAVAEYRHAK